MQTALSKPREKLAGLLERLFSPIHWIFIEPNTQIMELFTLVGGNTLTSYPTMKNIIVNSCKRHRQFVVEGQGQKGARCETWGWRDKMGPDLGSEECGLKAVITLSILRQWRKYILWKFWGHGRKGRRPPQGALRNTPYLVNDFKERKIWLLCVFGELFFL